MSDDTKSRFKMKLTVNGYTQADGTFTALAINTIINDMLMRLAAPPIDFGILHRALEGYHIHADMLIGKALLAYEIQCLANEAEDKPPPKPEAFPDPSPEPAPEK